MRSGRMDRLITIQAKTEGQSGSGEIVETWIVHDLRRRAWMRPLKGDETYSNPQEVAVEQVEFGIRRSGNVASLNPEAYRIVYPAFEQDGNDDDVTRYVYDILAVHEIGRGEGLRIIAERRPDVIATVINTLRYFGARYFS